MLHIFVGVFLKMIINLITSSKCTLESFRVYILSVHSTVRRHSFTDFAAQTV